MSPGFDRDGKLVDVATCTIEFRLTSSTYLRTKPAVRGQRVGMARYVTSCVHDGIETLNTAGQEVRRAVGNLNSG
ncbi:hypothetical protein SNOG_10971 [Parastagonospora nodorum SN15]|uniref:Uncharacterized protein n=1 Tax=Phaeosphaeria nodorum (strain SN15 / ATCC MYA-4574 / FGSC 10173) TaxID=321614 RepID=Q0UB93_PHANO|nr:hypothetical protein SNOG_10971 [Parastagonospora nodorum SN15]EAT81470.1 hypothetical protein SNOG_10971 [Parastagonospora nodorum SN15]